MEIRAEVSLEASDSKESFGMGLKVDSLQLWPIYVRHTVRFD